MEGRLYDLAAHLLDCTCQRLATKCPGRHCVVPGIEVSFENCCAGDTGGQLTVNVVRRYPSRTFPIPDFGTPRNCDAPYLVAVFAVTVLRCSPAGSAQTAPSCTALDEVAQRVFRDMEAVWDGIACCMSDEDAVSALVRGAYQWAFGNQTSVGPEGMCAGSSLEVLVGYPPCLEC